MRAETRRRLPLMVMLLAQLFVIAAAMSFHSLVRPELLATEPALKGGATALASSNWLLPTSSALGLGCALFGLISRRKRLQRLRIMGLGLTVSGLVFIAAVLMIFAALLG